MQKKKKKMVNIEEEHFHIFWTTARVSMKYLGKTWIMIILEATKKTGLHPLSTKQNEEGFLYSLKTSGNLRSNWPPQSFQG